jgi:putative hemolysin
MSQLDQHHGTRRTWKRVLPGIALLICVLGVLACGCTQKAPATSTPAPTASPAAPTIAQMANPAADHCHNMMGTYQIRTNPDGSQYGVCILPNNQICDAMKYMQQCVCVAPATPT